ncbi:hypothetical protein THAOC_37046, partial [Thalassiosira oceanica]
MPSCHEEARRDRPREGPALPPRQPAVQPPHAGVERATPGPLAEDGGRRRQLPLEADLALQARRRRRQGQEGPAGGRRGEAVPGRLQGRRRPPAEPAEVREGPAGPPPEVPPDVPQRR